MSAMRTVALSVSRWSAPFDSRLGEVTLNGMDAIRDFMIVKMINISRSAYGEILASASVPLPRFCPFLPLYP